MAELPVRRDPHCGKLQYGQPTEVMASGVAWFDLEMSGRLGAMIERDGFTKDGLHYACYIGYLALALEVATNEEILGDYGLVHEYAHGMLFNFAKPPYGVEKLTIGGSPCSHTKESFIALADDLQGRIQSAIDALDTET